MKDSKPDDISLFSAALAMPPAERDAFLAKACEGEPDRRESITELLRAHDSSAGFMETPLAPRVQRDRTSGGYELKSGDRIGNYELVRKIGEGGCGAVYLAQQHAPVRRKVAFKVIKLGMDTQTVIARFDAERDALARMEHANIARVLDAGATAAGRPFFVMELVQGIAITEYCDLHRLNVTQRLRLFMQVCRAVEHAHQKGVIHRDIKPSNILVTLQDGEPLPKVIDFGVAKATQGRLANQTLYTAAEQFVGTPAYMSPEQAESGEADVDTRTDIYSLGVLLYELLTGSTPYGIQMKNAAVDQVRRTIREVDPVRPSSRCQAFDRAEGALIAERRSATRAQLRAQLRGDLDWIAIKAMEKDRARRYDTVSALATDILRHLQSEPILARPPSTSYRIQKLVVRNKVSVLAAAAVFVALVTAVGVSTSRYVEERRARELAVAAQKAEAGERKRAEEAALRAEHARQETDAARKTAEAHRVASEQARAAAEMDRRNAELARVEAERAQDLAEKAQRRAEASSLDALTAARNLKANLYAADLHAVQNVLRSNGDLGQIQKILRSHIPAEGEPEVRGLEWYYAWKLAQGDALFSWRTQQGTVRCLAFSEDGRFLASGGRGEPGEQGQVRVWNASTHELVATFADTECAAFSPDSSLLITVTRDARVHLWRTATWEPAGEFAVEPFENGPGRRLDLTVASRGSLMAIGSGAGRTDITGSVRVCDWATKMPVARLDEAGAMAAFANDGQTLVTCTHGEGRIKVWNARTGALQRQLGALGVVSSMAVSPDGVRIAALTSGKSPGMRMFRLATLALERVIPIDEIDPFPATVAFSPDSEFVAMAGSDKRVRVWRAGSGRPISVMKGSAGPILVLAFSPDGERLYSAGRSDQIAAWPAAISPRENETVVTTLAPLRPSLESVVLRFSPGGRFLLAAEWERMLVVDTRTGKAAGRRGGHHVPLWFSQDGRTVLCLNQQRRTATRNDPIAKPSVQMKVQPPSGLEPALESLDLVSLPDCAVRRVRPLESAGEGVAAAAASFDGELVALAWQGGTGVAVYEASTGKTVRMLETRVGVPSALAFSPVDRKLAVAGSRGALEVWDLSSQDAPWTTAAHTGGIGSACFTADGTLLATSSSDLTHKFWSVSERREVARMMAFENSIEARFSPDGKTFWASTGTQLKLWHVPTQRDLGAFPLEQSLRHFDISPDQRAMAYSDNSDGERQLVLVRISGPSEFESQVVSAPGEPRTAPIRIRVPGAKPEFATADETEAGDLR